MISYIINALLQIKDYFFKNKIYELENKVFFIQEENQALNKKILELEEKLISVENNSDKLMDRLEGKFFST